MMKGFMVVLMLVFCVSFAQAHENGEYKHLKDVKIGPDVIWMVQCARNSWILYVDTNADRQPDEAYFVFNEHDETHYKPLNGLLVHTCEEIMRGD